MYELSKLIFLENQETYHYLLSDEFAHKDVNLNT